MKPKDLNELLQPKKSASFYGAQNGMSYEEYAEVPGVNYSSIKYLDEDLGCPEQAEWHLKFASEKKTEALKFGSAFHSMALDPEEWKTRYTLLDEDTANRLYEDQRMEGENKKSKAAYMTHKTYAEYIQAGGSVARMPIFKAWAAEQEAAGVEVITPARQKDMENMANALRKNSQAREALEQCPAGNRELSLFTTFPALGQHLRIKARLDLMSHNQSTILDLKTSRTAHPDQFSNQVVKLGYHHQAAWYVMIARLLDFDVKRFGWVAIEKGAPYCCAVHYMPDDWLRLGLQEVKAMIAECANRIKTDNWPGYPSGEIEPPQRVINLITELSV